MHVVNNFSRFLILKKKNTFKEAFKKIKIDRNIPVSHKTVN